MTDPIVRAIIEKAYPGARIIEKKEEEPRDLPSATPTPSAEAMIRKWGNPNTATAVDENEDDVVAVRVERSGNNASMPASLRTRTVIVNKATGEIVGEQG